MYHVIEYTLNDQKSLQAQVDVGFSVLVQSGGNAHSL